VKAGSKTLVYKKKDTAATPEAPRESPEAKLEQNVDEDQEDEEEENSRKKSVDETSDLLR